MKLFFTFLTACFFNSIIAQSNFDVNAVLEFQKELNRHYADSTESPLTKEDLKTFKSLDFYTIDSTFRVVAKFVRTKKEKAFEMPTSTERKPLYVKYGELHFELKGEKCILNVYQNVAFSKIKKYKKDLFLPFTDLTSGVESYGGGKYLDLKIPKKKTLIVDFNLSYNPYCAYNYKFSCPIPPKENDLKVEVKAGVKARLKFGK